MRLSERSKKLSKLPKDFVYNERERVAQVRKLCSTLGISSAKVASWLGISRPSATNKLNFETDFTVLEYKILADKLKAEIDIKLERDKVLDMVIN